MDLIIFLTAVFVPSFGIIFVLGGLMEVIPSNGLSLILCPVGILLIFIGNKIGNYWTSQ
jgi:hypothetical protein